MKVYSLNGIGNLVEMEREIPKAREGWAVVKVKAAGICSSDIPRIFKKGTYHFPTIPGHEFSGVVESCEDSNWLKKRVSVFPLIPCRQCEQCKQKNYQMCNNYDYIGSRRDGAFAEYVEVPIWNLLEMPENISFEEMAMMEPLSVAFHAVQQADIKKGDKVAIIGTGMIGIAAAQWASNKTENVFVIGRNADKKSIVEKINGVKYSQEKPKNEYDVVIEAVGSVSTINDSFDICCPGGKVVVMGNPEGDIVLSQNNYWKILRKELTVLGTWNSKYDGNNESDWTKVREELKNNKIQADIFITHRFSSGEMFQALDFMREHKEPYCKVMVLWGDEDEK